MLKPTLSSKLNGFNSFCRNYGKMLKRISRERRNDHDLQARIGTNGRSSMRCAIRDNAFVPIDFDAAVPVQPLVLVAGLFFWQRRKHLSVVLPQ